MKNMVRVNWVTLSGRSPSSGSWDTDDAGEQVWDVERMNGNVLLDMGVSIEEDSDAKLCCELEQVDRVCSAKDGEAARSTRYTRLSAISMGMTSWRRLPQPYGIPVIYESLSLRKIGYLHISS